MISAASSPNEIRRYQETLARAGYYLAGIDGIWGPKTQRANDAYIAAHSVMSADVNATNALSALEAVREKIIATAQHYLNLTETAPNARWDDVATAGADARAAELRAKLLETGWQTGWPYCAAFVDVCWRAGYQGRPELPLVSRSIALSAMGTFENFQALHRIHRDKPLAGALMLMQHGDSWQGHAGIVLGMERDQLVTIEGNTSSNLTSREGDGVYRKTKPFDLSRKPGLWIRGFVNPFLI